MNQEPADLDPLHDADWRQRSERLAGRISARLGQNPRALPSPVRLALEKLARPVLVAAAAVLVLSLTSVRLLNRAPVTPPGSLVDLLAAGQPPTAAEVYSLMRGYTLAPTPRDNRP